MRNRLGSRVRVARDESHAAREDRLLADAAEEERHLAVQGAAPQVAHRTARASLTAHDPAPLHRQHRGERPAQLHEHERGLGMRDREAPSLVVDREGGGAHLVRGAEIHPVDLAVPGHRLKVNDAGQEDDRQPRLAQETNQGPHPADAPSLTRLREHEEVEVAFTQGFDRHEGQPIPRGTGDEVEGSRLHQQIDQRLRPARELGGGNATFEKDRAVLKAAEIEAHRARVDAHDPRHQRPAARS